MTRLQSSILILCVGLVWLAGAWYTFKGISEAMDQPEYQNVPRSDAINAILCFLIWLPIQIITFVYNILNWRKHE